MLDAESYGAVPASSTSGGACAAIQADGHCIRFVNCRKAFLHGHANCLQGRHSIQHLPLCRSKGSKHPTRSSVPNFRKPTILGRIILFASACICVPPWLKARRCTMPSAWESKKENLRTFFWPVYQRGDKVRNQHAARQRLSPLSAKESASKWIF